MTHLTALANQYETDKGTVVRAGHGYSLLYDLILGPRRRDPLNLLEIGLCAADDKAEMPSVSMWRAYFPKAQVFWAGSAPSWKAPTPPIAGPASSWR